MENNKKSFKEIELFRLTKLQFFKLKISLILAFIPAIAVTITSLAIYLFAKLNLIFFEANGFIKSTEMRDAYYHYVMGGVFSFGSYLILFSAAVFLISFITLYFIFRPFNKLEHAMSAIIDGDDPQSIAFNKWDDIQGILTYGSKFIESFKSDVKIGDIPKTRKIDWEYMVKYLLIFMILSLVITLITGTFQYSIYENIANLSIKTLRLDHKQIYSFFSSQQEVLDFMLVFIGMFIFLFYETICYFLVLGISRTANKVIREMTWSLQSKFPHSMRIDHYDPLYDFMKKLEICVEKKRLETEAKNK